MPRPNACRQGHGRKIHRNGWIDFPYRLSAYPSTPALESSRNRTQERCGLFPPRREVHTGTYKTWSNSFMNPSLLLEAVKKHQEARTDLERLQGAWVSVLGGRDAEFLVCGERFAVRFRD